MNNEYEIVDISMPLTADYKMHTPVGVQDVQLGIQVIKDFDAPGGAGQVVRGITARLHHGTHVDAPEHFIRNGPQINDLSLKTFVGPAVVADVRHVGPGKPITPEDLENALPAEYQKGDRLLIRTDWNENYGRPDYVEGSPYLTMAATDWCVTNGFPIVGMDFAHTKDDPASPYRFFITRRFCESQVVTTMGYVRNLAAITNPRVLVIALPLALHGAEASPVRAVVLDGAL